MTSVSHLFACPGGGEGRSRFTKEVDATGECEEAAAAPWELLAVVLRTRLNFWRFANAQAGSHLRAHDRERGSIHRYNYDEGQHQRTGSKLTWLHLEGCRCSTWCSYLVTLRSVVWATCQPVPPTENAINCSLDWQTLLYGQWQHKHMLNSLITLMCIIIFTY